MSLLALLAIGWSFVHVDPALAAARAAHRPAMIAFVAEWCAACRVLERTALGDPAVAEESRRFVTARVDVTDDETEAKRLGVTALPTLLFFDGARWTSLVGTVDAKALVTVMRAVR
jgi:thiol:disulfide interchange protein DsbD